MRDRLIQTVLLFVLGLTFPASAQEQMHRHHDNRQPVNTKKAATNGIQRYESKRLILFTDLDPAKARELVKLVDQVYPAWEAQFGKLPEARDKSEFQITGYLMVEADKFVKAGLLRRNPASIVHGQNDGYEFWMHDQKLDYYREHLLIHEATHCVTQCPEGDDQEIRPLWFIEGMAEFFGTHQFIETGAAGPKTLKFGVFPESAKLSAGFGRVELIRIECAEGRVLSAEQVLGLGQKEFSESRSTPYAWSWALCTFLAMHPATAADFHTVCQQWDSTQFRKVFQQFWMQHREVITSDWEIFRESLCYGFDLPSGATIRGEATPLGAGAPRETMVLANRGWQSTGISVQAGQSLLLTASGRVVLKTTTEPWESEPAGISIRYSEGRPIGRLLAAVERKTPASDRSVEHWEFYDVTSGVPFPVAAEGTVYLRVNDRWNELAENSGEYQVRVTTPP